MIQIILYNIKKIFYITIIWDMGLIILKKNIYIHYYLYDLRG